MTKRRRNQQQEGTPPSSTPHSGTTRGSTQGLALATLGGVMLVLMISFANWREIDRIEENLDRRLGQIDNRITEIAAKVDRPAAPAKGPARAAVTIAEYSDFQ